MSSVRPAGGDGDRVPFMFDDEKVGSTTEPSLLRASRTGVVCAKEIVTAVVLSY